MKFIFLTILLYYIRLASFEARDHGLPPSCCLTVTNTRIPIINILDYYRQETMPCPIRAVRFHTRMNKTICSSPDDNWAKNAMKELNARRNRVSTKPSKEPFVCSKSNQIPTTTTPIKTSRPETETSTSTVTSISTVPSIVSTFKTPTPETETSTSNFNIQVLKSSVECCLTVTKHKPAFHKIVDYRVQEAEHCSIGAILFMTIENKTICSSPVQDWTQDYIKDIDRRKTTEKTDNKRELSTPRPKPTEQKRRSTKTIETFQLDGLTKVEKQEPESLKPAMTLSPIISDENKTIYSKINHRFCLKEQEKYSSSYFCIKQP